MQFTFCGVYISWCMQIKGTNISHQEISNKRVIHLERPYILRICTYKKNIFINGVYTQKEYIPKNEKREHTWRQYVYKREVYKKGCHIHKADIHTNKYIHKQT